jgi:hypothetical protein
MAQIPGVIARGWMPRVWQLNSAVGHRFGDAVHALVNSLYVSSYHLILDMNRLRGRYISKTKSSQTYLKY